MCRYYLVRKLRYIILDFLFLVNNLKSSMKKILSLLMLLNILSVCSFAQSTISKGSSVKILEVGKSDAYYGERAEFVGKNATALSDVTKNPTGFYTGTLETEGGRTCFFTSIKITVTAAAKTGTTTAKSTTTKAAVNLFTGESIPKDTRFVVLEVPSEDAYHSSKDEIEGKTGTTTREMTLENGYTSGSVTLDNGKSYYFYKVKLGKSSSKAPAKSTLSAEPKVAVTTPAKTPKFITGTIKKGTKVYVADISPDDSYYSDRYDYVGKRGKVDTASDLQMKEDGYYAGDFIYDDGSTAYFYKAKFSKEPVDKLVRPANEPSKSNSSDDDDWGYFFDELAPKSDSSSSEDTKEWTDAKNDEGIKSGDRVEITAVSSQDSYYDDKVDYIGQKGEAGDDLEYDSDEDGYGGTIKLDNGSSPYFYLVKIKKSSSRSGSYKSSSSSASTSSVKEASSEVISKNTKVMVTDISSEDSFYSDKGKYLRKKGKVASELNNQGDGYYSGRIIFDDGTDAYFYMVKVTILK